MNEVCRALILDSIHKFPEKIKKVVQASNLLKRVLKGLDQ